MNIKSLFVCVCFSLGQVAFVSGSKSKMNKPIMLKDLPLCDAKVTSGCFQGKAGEKFVTGKKYATDGVVVFPYDEAAVKGKNVIVFRIAALNDRFAKSKKSKLAASEIKAKVQELLEGIKVAPSMSDKEAFIEGYEFAPVDFQKPEVKAKLRTFDDEINVVDYDQETIDLLHSGRIDMVEGEVRDKIMNQQLDSIVDMYTRAADDMIRSWNVPFSTDISAIHSDRITKQASAKYFRSYNFFDNESYFGGMFDIPDNYWKEDEI